MCVKKFDFVYICIYIRKQQIITNNQMSFSSFLCSTTTNYPIPLLSQNVYLTTVDQIANFVIVQSYSNKESKPIEAVLRFPTPGGAAVYCCEAKVDDKQIKLEIKEKTKAKEEYNKGISQGDTAYYAQSESSDVMTMAVGNLAPQSDVQITIKYVVFLDNEEDYKKFRVIFPLTIMPRYSPRPQKSNKKYFSQSALNPPKITKKPFSMSIEGDIFVTDGLVSLDSKTHKIKISDTKKNGLHFEIQDLDKINRDVVLTLERTCSKSCAVMQEFCLTSQEFKSSIDSKEPLDARYKYCTYVNIVPEWDKYPPININAIHYVIVLDRSSSMYGKSFDICKKAAQQFVSLLPIGCTFDVYEFSDLFTKYDNSEKSSDINSQKLLATQWISSLTADGGTEILPVLTDIYESFKKIEKTGVIVFLSDGDVTNTNEIFSIVKQNPNVSIFPIGIGDNVSQGLIQGLASHGNGHVEFVGSCDKNIIQKVRSQLKKSQDLLRKYQKNYDIEIVTIGGASRNVPEKLPPLFEKTNNSIYVFSEYRPACIKFIENLNSPMEKTTKIIPELIENENYYLHRIAGAKLLSELEHSSKNTSGHSKVQSGSKIDDLKVDADVDPFKTEIINISTNLNILSKYTAFVGVDVKKNKVTSGMGLRTIPLQMPNTDTDDEDYEKLVESGCSSVLDSPPSAKYLPSSTDDWFEAVDVVSIKDSKSINIYKPIGVNTVGSTDLVDLPDVSRAHKAISDAFDNSMFDTRKFNGVFNSKFSEKFVDDIRTASKPTTLFKPNKSKSCAPVKPLAQMQYTALTWDDIPDHTRRTIHDRYDRAGHLGSSYIDEKTVSKPDPKKLNVKYEVKVCLNKSYIVLDNNEILSSTSNVSLIDTLKSIITDDEILKKLSNLTFVIGDIIELTAEVDTELNQFYEIISVGSTDEPWVLVKIN
jgi:hypothetical protein